MPSQAQKHVTHNEALRMLDALLHIRVERIGTAAPPEEPAEGERHVVGAAPSGAFAGHEGEIAAFQDGAWAFLASRPGWTVWDAESAALRVSDGGSWTGATPPPERLPALGVNTDADAANRLAVAVGATLLTHDGGGHRLKPNKAAAGETGSVLLQTGWSGRAEMGLAVNDDFSIKVSPHGAAWNSVLTADRVTGNVSISGHLGIGTTSPVRPLHVAGAVAAGDAINQTRLTSGTPGNAGRGFSLIDTNAVMRVWRRATGSVAAVVELAVGDGSDNIADALIQRWDIGVSYGSNRFEIRRLSGGTLVSLSIQSNGRIGVGTQTPHASAQFEVASTERGFLPPRMTTAQRDAITSPAEGLMIYNITEHEPQFWNGSNWVGRNEAIS